MATDPKPTPKSPQAQTEQVSPRFSRVGLLRLSLTGMLGALAVLSFVWSPLRLSLPLLAIGVLLPVAQSCISAVRASFPPP